MPTDRNPVVWFEGMSLDPHHFQQWDRAHRHTGRRHLRAAQPYAWGFFDLELDEDRLAGGDVVVVRCSGLFPDGTAVEIPACDPAPDPRNVRQSFDPTRERMCVYLAIPATPAQTHRPIADDSLSARRHLTETVTVSDETPGGDARPVEVARLNTHIRLEGEALDAFTTLPLTSLKRTADGALAQAPDFIPPVLRIDAASRIRHLVRRLLEQVGDYRRSLRRRITNVRGQQQLSPSDATAFALLQTVSAALPVLQHHHHAGTAHPVDLYRTLVGLAARLDAFRLSDPSDDPATSFRPYDHDDLTGSFAPLVERLHTVLGETLPPSHYEIVQLVREREHLFTASLSEEHVASCRLYLSIRNEPDARTSAEELPALLRIASPQTIDAVLKSYTRALPVRALTTIPAGVPVNGEAHYFQLLQTGPFWESIEDAGAMAIFIPHASRDLDLQLVAVPGP